jgi:hypothetical protein
MRLPHLSRLGWVLMILVLVLVVVLLLLLILSGVIGGHGSGG